MGDFAAKRWPHHGRIWACQFSVAIGIPFSVLILKVLVSTTPQSLHTSTVSTKNIQASFFFMTVHTLVAD